MIDLGIIKEAKVALSSAADERAVAELRVKYLGRKGLVTAELKSVGTLAPRERAAAGAAANKASAEIEAAIAEAENRLRLAKLEQSTQDARLDLTAPSDVRIGHLHPVGQLMDEIVRLFWQMGFSVADGPEVETEWYNFEALLVGADHPARDMQDTFYSTTPGLLPRTHTSGVQVRYMETHEPPIRIIAPGKVYRNEDEDNRHLWMFYQVEGLVVDKGISMADLKGTLLAMLKGLLGDDIGLRLRPNFFPYTEPSVEMDATCIICRGKGCRTCSGTGWIELGGAGMVHPQVLRNVGIDPHVYSGFAFGFGPERIALVKYGIDDIRYFWRPDLRFLEQF